MKLIHTSDWHLGHRLYNYDRADEESRFFGQLAALVAQERPDALLVSGDVFHSGAHGNDVAKSFTDRLLEILAGSPDTVAVVIAGNHDSYSRLEISQSLWRRCRVHVLGTPGETADGDADFSRNVIEIDGRGLVAAVPFCHPRNFPSVRGAADDDRQTAYFRGLRAYVEGRNAAHLPTVLAAHLAVGKETDFTGQTKLAVIGGEECVEPAALGLGYDYIALGHIHCPQWVRGSRRVIRYCGTPRAIHFDEDYPHGVDIVEVAAGAAPVLRTARFEPLRGLRTIGGRDGLPFEDALKDLEAAELPPETYVRLNVVVAAGERIPVEWTERARQMSASRGFRFCLLNPVRPAAEPQSAAHGARLTMEALKELSDEEVLTILSSARKMTDRQKELLRGLMTELSASEGAGGAVR